MKYIRTNILGEEDIYFINDIFLGVGRIYLSNKKSNIAVDICSKKDLESLGKIADTIEELCDKFIAIDVGVKKDHKKYYNSLFEAKNDKKFLCDHIYGAIQTNEGLLYVAKMNEKGVLEFL